MKVKFLNHVVFIGAKGPESAKPNDVRDDLPDDVALMLISDGDAVLIEKQAVKEEAQEEAKEEAPKPAQPRKRGGR